MLAAIITYFI